MKCLPLVLIVSAVVYHSTAWAQTANQTAVTVTPILNAPLPPQDEAQSLLADSYKAALLGDKERAFAICERVLQLPPQPPVSPPPFPYFETPKKDLALWQMAEIRRSQQRWNEALALYQSNPSYPGGGGCVPNYFINQEAAMVQGECLEHLGRFDEAVTLYLSTSFALGEHMAPEAMRRLVDIYQATNQREDLERAISQAPSAFQEKMKREWGATDRGEWQPTQDGPWVLPVFERVRHFRDMARLHRWDQLIEVLRETDFRHRAYNWTDSPEWNRREAIAALKTLDAFTQEEAVRALQDFIQRNPPPKKQDPYILVRAMILLLQGPEKRHEAPIRDYSAMLDLSKNSEDRIQKLAPRQPMPIPLNFKLPVALSVQVQDQ